MVFRLPIAHSPTSCRPSPDHAIYTGAGCASRRGFGRPRSSSRSRREEHDLHAVDTQDGLLTLEVSFELAANVDSARSRCRTAERRGDFDLARTRSTLWAHTRQRSASHWCLSRNFADRTWESRPFSQRLAIKSPTSSRVSRGIGPGQVVFGGGQLFDASVGRPGHSLQAQLTVADLENATKKKKKSRQNVVNPRATRWSPAPTGRSHLPVRCTGPPGETRMISATSSFSPPKMVFGVGSGCRPDPLAPKPTLGG